MASEGSVSEGSNLKSAQLLELVKAHLATDVGKELQQKIGFTYQINIAPKKIGVNEESFVVDLKNLKVYKGVTPIVNLGFLCYGIDGHVVVAGKCEGKPDATFSFADADFMAVSSGSMNPQMAFIRGKMKIKGSMSAAQKFTPDIFPKPSKL